MASAILERRIAEVNGIRRAKAVVEQAIEQMQDGIVVLDRYAPWKQFVVQTDALFVVSPSQRGGFSAQAVPVSAKTMPCACRFRQSGLVKAPSSFNR